MVEQPIRNRQVASSTLALGSTSRLAELGKTEADITDTDARYRYLLSQIVLSYTVGAPR